MPLDVRAMAASECNNKKHYDIAEFEIDWIKSWKINRMLKTNFTKLKLYVKDHQNDIILINRFSNQVWMEKLCALQTL